MEDPEGYMERRVFERTPSNVQVKFYYGYSVYFGTITNCSESGMFVRTNKIFFPLHTHSKFELFILCNNKVLKLPVKVIRIEKMDGICYGMGVELQDITENYLELLCSVR